MKKYDTKFITKPTDKWFVINVEENTILGRLAAFIAMRLLGKHNPQYTRHMECGDKIIVLNTDNLYAAHGKRLYHRHTGYMGHVRTTRLDDDLEKRSDYTLRRAVYRMLPRMLRDTLIKNLRVLKDNNHNHHAQVPQELHFNASVNEKNILRS